MAAKSKKLEDWQKRLADSNSAYSAEVRKMDERERLYNGACELRPLVPGDTGKDGGIKKTSHVRNIIFENIEAQVSTSIPQPKVTPRRKKDEHLADVIEHFLRNELDRMPFETINDLAERTVPMQGGIGFLVEWDSTKRAHGTVGEVTVTPIHPKQLAPQPGVYTGIEDMDWIIIKVPTTKQAVKARYDVDVDSESESEPDVRTAGGADTSEDAVTEYIGFEKNGSGGINRYCWVNDTELEDLEDYLARRQPVCRHCGRVRPLPGQIISAERIGAGNLLPDPERGFIGTLIPPELMERKAAGQEIAQRLAAGIAGGFKDGIGEDSSTPLRSAQNDRPFSPNALKQGEPKSDADNSAASVLSGVEIAPGKEPEPERYDGGPCPWCGGDEWTDEQQEFEQVMLPIRTSGGLEVPGMHAAFGETGQPELQSTMIPSYKPRSFPIILQRSVSVYGQLLGNSDVDVIKDQQNTVNRLEQKIIDRIVKAGTRITLPNKANLKTDPEDGERWFIDTPADKQLIDVYDFTGNLQFELTYLQQVYEEARQLIGITDSFQGRHDATATSGVAKQYSAAQAAGRLESKRIMKQAAYASLFEMMFRFWLAYSDEPRPVVFKNSAGETQYEEFSRYDFLEQDSDGTYWWNDQFLFSCDTSAPLASNREAMWQETRMNLQTGAFGDPTQTDTLILFWTKMEELHYPGAGMTREVLERRREKEQQAAQAQAMQQAAGATSQAPAISSPDQGSQGGGGLLQPAQAQIPPEIAAQIDRRAAIDAGKKMFGAKKLIP